MDSASGPRGRGRGRGSRQQDAEAAAISNVALNEPLDQGACGGGRPGRGRGRGAHLPAVDPEPFTLPENPEDDDFFSAFRRLQVKGRGRGRGFRLPAEPEDSGVHLRNEFLSSTPATTAAIDLERIPVSSRSVASMVRPEVCTDSVVSNFKEVPVTKRGSKGRHVNIISNILKLSVSKNMGLFEYHVDFDPPLELIRFKRKIMYNLAQKLGSAHTFDGAKLYLAKKLEPKISTHPVDHPSDPSVQVDVKIKFVKENSLTECIHFYNVLLRRIMEVLGMVEMKRNYYDHRAVYDIPHHKLEIWPGYVTAVDELEGGLMLCCDSSFRVLRTSTILEILENFHSNDVNESKKRFVDYVLGKVVLTRYNNKNYRIDDVDWTKNPLSTFTNSKGQEISFVHYYKEAYNVDIKNMRQPLLVHRPKPIQRNGPIPLICLVPELCYITGLDTDITSNYHIMKDLAVFTKLTPAQRNLALEKFTRNVNECPEAKSILDKWGLTLEKAAATLEGRVLSLPEISLNKNNKFVPDKANFTNNVTSSSIYDPKPVRSWLLFFSERDKQRSMQFVEQYQLVTRPFGIPVSFDMGHAISVGRGSVKDFCSALEKHLNSKVQFVVVVVPSQRDDLYSAIKKICTVNKPIPSQVILSKTLQDGKKFRSVVQKIALQINCKIGGSLWSIRVPLPERIMFVGFDVYHDPRKRNCSVTGIVATLNPSFTKYYSRVIFQERHQETVNSMLPILVDLFIAFAEENSGYPDRVIVWRDGVSDGQLMYTKGHEVPQILNAFKSLGFSPKFTFCVVQKRINARLFLKGNYGPLSNPEPGTVIDHTITRKYLYDFFLVSQLVKDGTVTPSHFIVLEDNADVPPDLIQKFAFATCFLYYNWCGSIRVPAMCQYAHKLAGLVGQYTRQEPSLELAKNLYYL